MNPSDFINLQCRLDRIAFALDGEDRETVIEARVELFEQKRALDTVRAALGVAK